MHDWGLCASILVGLTTTADGARIKPLQEIARCVLMQFTLVAYNFDYPLVQNVTCAAKDNAEQHLCCRRWRLAAELVHLAVDSVCSYSARKVTFCHLITNMVSTS